MREDILALLSSHWQDRLKRHEALRIRTNKRQTIVAVIVSYLPLVLAGGLPPTAGSRFSVEEPLSISEKHEENLSRILLFRSIDEVLTALGGPHER